MEAKRSVETPLDMFRHPPSVHIDADGSSTAKGGPRQAATSLGKAATIAARYSCVRKQGFRDTTAVAGAGAPEFTIMDYRVQQYQAMK